MHVFGEKGYHSNKIAFLILVKSNYIKMFVVILFFFLKKGKVSITCLC